MRVLTIEFAIKTENQIPQFVLDNAVALDFCLHIRFHLFLFYHFSNMHSFFVASRHSIHFDDTLVNDNNDSNDSVSSVESKLACSKF